MVDHQGCQLFAPDEDDLRRNDPRVLLCFSGEAGSCDEDPLVCTLALKGSGEFLDFRAADGSLPTFGLYVDHVEAELVFLDDPVNAAIAASAYRLSCVPARASIAHGDQQIDDQALEEGRRGGLYLLQYFCFQIAAQPLIGLREQLLWCGLGYCRCRRERGQSRGCNPPFSSLRRDLNARNSS